ncbi:pentatricopeptide repeat-containing protein At2g17033-like [Wolffia australiana]
MRDLGVVFSIRTCNSALNSCPGLSALLMGDDQSRPVSLEALMLQLGGDQEEEEEEEGMIVKELVGSRALLQTTMRWSSLEGKLDLHGYHLGSAFVAVLQLIDELKDRFLGNDVGIPRHIIIVCGSGKNSRNMGESPVKKMVSGVLFKLGSPFKIDRKNVGRLFAGGSAVRDWLLKLQAS